MSRDEKVLLTLLFTALTALVLWRVVPRGTLAPLAATVNGPAPVATQSGDGGAVVSYLRYNYPWAFAPPIQGFVMPRRDQGQIGAAIPVPCGNC